MVGMKTQPTTKLLLLPSVLAVILTLGACQKNAPPAENEASDTTQSAEVIGSAAEIENGADINESDIDETVDASKVAELSPEQQMIANLARYRWTLLTAKDASAQALAPLMNINDQVTLLFNQHQGQNTLSYSVGCNTMSAGYELQAQTLTTEDSMSTKMSCGDLDSAENLLNTLMQGNSELSVSAGEPPLLTQVTNDSMTLVWTGRLTAQAKYSGKGKTVFWAVNSEKVACGDGDSSMCLQVKPVTYDDQGLKTSEGEWTAFNGDIDGYQHDGMHEEVLRLQRYQVNDIENPDNESTEAYAYVLDAVIESSVVE
ncbi:MULTISPECIES: META domain-containing protein [Psychrobacter]|jgi:hypothetical protein|uniref:META domain-containing protein n=2 Tax=Moraxellaceae TaxID=468 RepID=UPI0015656625|nr:MULTISPECIES: DUF4377 domain-containing protein [Psychrobacter]NRD70538.1 META and DUF4377 domain-containing protein [Psychrobacter okhotskensis]